MSVTISIVKPEAPGLSGFARVSGVALEQEDDPRVELQDDGTPVVVIEVINPVDENSYVAALAEVGIVVTSIDEGVDWNGEQSGEL